jgi:hypothetical protein
LLFLKHAWFTGFYGVKWFSSFRVPKKSYFGLTGKRQPAMDNLSVFGQRILTYATR